MWGVVDDVDVAGAGDADRDRGCKLIAYYVQCCALTRTRFHLCRRTSPG